MRRTAAAALALLTGGALALTGSAAASAAGCSTAWGSLDKTVPGGGGSDSRVGTVRSGHHTCYDRVVFDVSGTAPAVTVGYVPVVYSDGKGEPVPLRGAAFLHVVLRGAQPPAVQGSELVGVTGLPTLRQVASTGGFEGYDTYGVGVRGRLPFRAFVLTGPGAGSRVVLDLAHRW